MYLKHLRPYQLRHAVAEGWPLLVPELRDVAAWGRVEVMPMILPAASPPAGGDHAGYNETSFLLATRPELVEQDRLDAEPAPWYCREHEQRNSWTANAEHGAAMVDAVVDAWVARLRQQ